MANAIINGKRVEFQPGMTILQAARAANISLSLSTLRLK